MPLSSLPVILIKRHLLRNVPDLERAVSAYSGVRLMAKSLSYHGLVRLAFLTAGALLVRRGWTGHCPVYEAIGEPAILDDANASARYRHHQRRRQAEAETPSLPPPLDVDHGGEVTGPRRGNPDLSTSSTTWTFPPRS